jgi:transposase
VLTRKYATNRPVAMVPPCSSCTHGGGKHWAVVASLVETCKLNGVNPHAYLTDARERILAGHPQSRIDELMPWRYVPIADL